MLQIVSKVVLPKNKYIVMIPNAGYPEQLQHRMVFRDNQEYFKDNMLKMKEYGAHMIGGCCGTTPDFIRELKNMLKTEGNPASKCIACGICAKACPMDVLEVVDE